MKWVIYMNFIKRMIASIVFTQLLYAVIAVWMYIESKSDITGFKALGIFSFVSLLVLPLYSVIAGIVGQLILKNTLMPAIINSVGSMTFLIGVYLVVNNLKPIILIIIPAVFIFTLLFSCITLLIQKLITKRRVPT